MRRLAPALFALAAITTASVAAAQTRTWDFQVYLDTRPIGHHRFVLNDGGGEAELRSSARFNVKVLGFNAYRYVHDATERWRRGCLASVTARTDDNGEHSVVDAAQANDRLAVSGPRAGEPLTGCVLTFAYWNPAILRASRLLNVQTGEHEAVKVARVADESIAVRGTSVAATRYRITGPKNPIDLWYSPQSEWLQLEASLEGGRRLRYLLQ